MVATGESYLRRALEALLDLARHVLAKGFARGPAEHAEVARQLGEVGVVTGRQSQRLVLMARYRNLGGGKTIRYDRKIGFSEAEIEKDLEEFVS